ncbi:pectinesterase family protein [Epilithonimonas sp.]|uniref:pectinesterase family protein n=1 Tax=Epilithonimonas sp. TaxID=2894511 RepID=UPI00289733D8|nr:pectinesterase family protein [Epilithonimonas sp.]
MVTAPSTEATTKYGFVFLDCNLTVPAAGTTDFNGTVISNFHFGRAWQNTPKSAFIRCETPAMLNPTGWTTPINGTLPVTFVEYGNTGAGATADRLLQRANGGVVLTATEAASFTISNIFKKDTDPSFVFDWMPEASVNIDLGTLATTDVNKKRMKVYPNPFTDRLTLSYQLKSDSDVTISLYDNSGRIVKYLSEKAKSGDNKIVVDGSTLKPGIYYYSVKSSSEQLSGKLIKK